MWSCAHMQGGHVHTCRVVMWSCAHMQGSHVVNCFQFDKCKQITIILKLLNQANKLIFGPCTA